MFSVLPWLNVLRVALFFADYESCIHATYRLMELTMESCVHFLGLGVCDQGNCTWFVYTTVLVPG